MPNAVLDRSVLADALVGVVDTIRGKVHGALGTRPWRVSIITRRWSGQVLGEGTPTDSIMVLIPDPQVVRGGTNRLGPGGMEGNDSVTLSAVSLTYTEDELMPRDLPPGVEVVYMLERLFGGDPNTSRVEFFTIENSPTPQRGDKPGDRIGWVIQLHEVQGFSPVDGTNA